MTYEIREVPLSKLQLNTGQIYGVPKNPRFIKDSRFTALVKSIQDAPEMTELRELIAYDNGGELVVICGNMRMRAMRELKIKTAKVKVLSSDTPAEKLREYTIKDNISFGSDDWELLANEWDVPDLSDWGFELPEMTSPDDFGDEFSLPDGDKGDTKQITFVLSNEQADFINEQLKIAQYSEDDTFGNKNSNGNAIYSIVKQWADVRR